MTKLNVVLVGWGQDGHDGKCPTYLPVDERVGGETRMRALVDWCRGHDILLGVHTSHYAAYRCSDEFNADEVIRHRSGEQWQGIVWSGGREHRLCPQVALEKYVKRELPALARLGFHGHHHYDCVGAFMCCYAPGHPVPARAAYIQQVREQFNVALQVMGSVSTEMPFGQYFGVVDGFYHCYSTPGRYLRDCPVGRYFLDRSVPLLGVALHGSHNCCESIGAADQARLLDMLDLGLAPQCEVCMRPSPAFGLPAYAVKADQMAEAYRFAFGTQGYMSLLGMLDIEGRWELAPGVNRTRYSDGTLVEVNRNDTEWLGLPGHSFRLIDAKPVDNEPKKQETV